MALLGNARFVVFMAGLFLVGAAFVLKWFAPVWLLVPVVVFIALSIAYQRAARVHYAARLAVAYHERGLARLEDRWAGGGNPGTRFLDSEHPNAADLDLFGPGSVFELLCTARTRGGEGLPPGWLRAAAQPAARRPGHVP